MDHTCLGTIVVLLFVKVVCESTQKYLNASDISHLSVSNSENVTIFTVDSTNKSNCSSLCDEQLTMITPSSCKFDDLLTLAMENTCTLNFTQVVDYSSSGLNNINFLICEFIPNVDNINLSQNDIQVLNENFLNSCADLRILLLNNNLIRDIDRSTFAGGYALEFLDVSNNKVTRLLSGVFDSLENLRYINLSRNYIQYIAGDAFIQTGNLISVDISYNNLYSLGSSIFYGAFNIQTLYLQANYFEDNNFDFLENFHSLDELDMSRNSFKAINSNSFGDYNITRIYLSNMKSLEWFSSNVFGNSSVITEIHLQNNPNLVLHKDAFSGLRRLRVLNLSGSKVLAFPELGNDTIIDLSNTSVTCNCVAKDVNLTRYNSNDNMYCRFRDGIYTNRQDLSDISVPCGPYFQSYSLERYFVRLSDKCSIKCNAFGQPWPSVSLEHCSGTQYAINEDECFLIKNNISVYELEIDALNQEGLYRCSASANNRTVYKYFSVIINRTEVNLKLVSRGESWVIVTWDENKSPKYPVILSRPYESTSDFVSHSIHAKWRLYKVSHLNPRTGYEICMASGLDHMDRKCIRTWTKRKENKIAGVHKDSVVLSVIIVSGLVFTAFVVSTCIRCVSKVRNISQRYVYIVNSESSNSFREVTFGNEQLYTNPCADFDIESNMDS